MSVTRNAGVAVAVVLAGVLGACGASGAATPTGAASPVVPAGPSTSAGQQSGGGDAVLGRRYASFGQLRADSTGAVVFVAGQPRVEKVTGGDGLTTDVTITPAEKVTTVWGQAPPELEILQVGSAGDTGGLSPIVERGHRYFAFIRPSTRPPAYAVTGAVTAYEIVDGQARRLNADRPEIAGGQASDLPGSIAEKDLPRLAANG